MEVGGNLWTQGTDNGLGKVLLGHRHGVWLPVCSSVILVYSSLASEISVKGPEIMILLSGGTVLQEGKRTSEKTFRCTPQVHSVFTPKWYLFGILFSEPQNFQICVLDSELSFVLQRLYRHLHMKVSKVPDSDKIFCLLSTQSHCHQWHWPSKPEIWKYIVFNVSSDSRQTQSITEPGLCYFINICNFLPFFVFPQLWLWDGPWPLVVFCCLF